LTAPDQKILSLIPAVAFCLNFAPDHPFTNSLFDPVLRWTLEEKEVLQKVKDSCFDATDLNRIWELVTVDFPSYRKGLRAAYIKMIEETYARADIPLP
jgi:hypothetical protein